MRFLLAVFLMLTGPLAMADDDALVIYSGRSDKFVKPVIAEFTKQTGIKVILHSAKSTELINKLQVEAERSPADLYISNDAGNLQVGSNMGLFAPLPAEMLEPVHANYRAADNTWVGLSARARVLVANTERLGELDYVKSVFDLADPRLKGKLAITHSANESFIAGVTVYMEQTSPEAVLNWLKGMKANTEGKVYNKHGKIVSDVAAGNKAIGLVNHYYIFRHFAKHPDAPIKVLIPDQGDKGIGVAWNVAGIAMVKHSKKQDQARKLIAFLVSEQGQKMFAEVNREYPTRGDVPAASEIPPAAAIKVADVPMSALGDKRNPTLDLIDKAGMY